MEKQKRIIMRRILAFIFFITALHAQAQFGNFKQLRFVSNNQGDTTATGTNDGRMWYDFSTDEFRVTRAGTNYSLNTGAGGGGGWPLTGSASLTGDVSIDGQHDVLLGIGTPLEVMQIDAVSGVDLLGFNGNASLQMQDGAWTTYEKVSGTSLAAQTFVYRLGLTTGTAAAGFGMYHDYVLWNDINTLTSAHTKTVTWTDPSDGAEYAKVTLGVRSNGSIVNPLQYTGVGVGIFTTTPTARLHLPAGTATAGTAPLKLTTGTALTTEEDGALEYHSSHLYFTIGSTRYQLDQQSGGGWATTGTTTLTGGVTIAQAGNNILFHNGNILFGPTSSTITANTKVDIRGIGTGTNTSLRVADSGNTVSHTMLDNGAASWVSRQSNSGSGTSFNFSQTGATDTGAPTNGAFFRLLPDQRATSGAAIVYSMMDLAPFVFTGGSSTGTSIYSGYRLSGSLSGIKANFSSFRSIIIRASSSETGWHREIDLSPTYNFTGTYSGNVYGLYYNPTLTSMTGATHVAAAFASGDVVIGATTPTTDALLDLQSTTKAFILPRMTEAQRDAIGTPSAGMIIYNTDTNVLNFYNGSAWGAI